MIFIKSIRCSLILKNHLYNEELYSEECRVSRCHFNSGYRFLKFLRFLRFLECAENASVISIDGICAW